MGKKKKRIGREQWGRGSVLSVEVLGISPIIVGIWRKRNLYRCPQINLKC